MEDSDLKNRIDELPAQSKNVAFSPNEMIVCPKCQRNNPPTRLNCFYCARELEISEAQLQLVKPNFRKLENWEKGFNLIYQPITNFDFSDSRLLEIAELVKLEKDVLQKVFDSQSSFPLARVESEKEAQIIQARLREFGVESFVLSDEVLAADQAPQRLRGIEFFDNKLILILFNHDQIIEILPEDLILIVWGVNFERRIESSEKRSKNTSAQISESSETTSDESLFDIYSRQNASGFRIFAKGFDFSALETEKELLAKDNLKKLVSKIREIAPAAKYVEDYRNNRNVLSAVWEVEHRTEAQGLKREGFGKFNFGSVVKVNNLAQFTKYSRLQWHLL